MPGGQPVTACEVCNGIDPDCANCELLRANTRYIVLDRKTHENDWDGITHPTREAALESLCSPFSSYVRTPAEEDDDADGIRTYWERDYRICEIRMTP